MRSMVRPRGAMMRISRSADHDGAGRGRLMIRIAWVGQDPPQMNRPTDRGTCGCLRRCGDRWAGRAVRGPRRGGDRAVDGSPRGGDRARIDAPRVKGGSRPTPVEPPHGSGNLWVFETSRGSMAVDRGVVPIGSRHHPDDVTSVARPHKRLMPGIAGVVPRPTHRVVDHRPSDPRRVVDHRPHDPHRVVDHRPPDPHRRRPHDRRSPRRDPRSAHMIKEGRC
jgi:hypothetical protein